MEFKLGQKVEVKDSGVIYEITTNFENGQRIKTYSIISDIDNERICLSENKIEGIKSDEKTIKNIIKNIFKFKTKLFKKIEEINNYITYSKCYSDMKSIGLAAFECCNGIIGISCDNCPYYRRNKEFKKMKEEFVSDKEITNGDKIRNMSNEELAKFCLKINDCSWCNHQKDSCDAKECQKYLTEWLNSPIKKVVE